MTAAPRWTRWVGAAALVLLCALLLVDARRLVAGGIAAIGYPYGLDYGEGIVWQQMNAIAAGRGYAPLGVYPAIVYHYPPAYHLLVAAVTGASGADPLAVGRAVSLAATLAAMACIARLGAAAAAADRRSAAIGGGIAALAFGAAPTVMTWAPMMRVDMLATALSLAGLWATLASLRARRRFVLAAALFALAVYTKQTAIAAPAAAAAMLWLTDRRAAWRLAVLCGAMGLIALAALMIQTNGGFLRHVVSYNVNRFDAERWRFLLNVLLMQTIPLALAGTVIIRYVARSTRSPAMMLALAYFASRLLLLPLMLKSGSNEYYLNDIFSSAAILAAVAVADVVSAVVAKAPWPRAIVTCLVLVGLPVQAARGREQHPAITDRARAQYYDRLVRRIAAARRPVVSDEMVLLLRAGRPVTIEPAIVAELAHSGLYDEAALRRLIARRAFAFFIVQDPTGGRLYAERYNPQVRAAIAAAYPRVERAGDIIVHAPAAAVSPPADRAPPPPR